MSRKVFTPIKREPNSAINEMASPRTPDASSSFSRELRQVLQERNLLTARTRNKVCSMLGGGARSSPRGTPSNAEVDKRTSFRLQAIQEIISSEKTYLQQLEMLMEYFVRPLKKYSIIDNASHTALFGQIEMIYSLNGEFLRELEDDRQHVSQLFLRMAPFFKLYSVYAFDYRNALFIVQDLTSKNAPFRRFLEETESRPEVGRKLNSLMIVPIQRVPRYKLLLEQVLLYTSPSDADFRSLKESIKQIESTVSHINACVEDQETTQLLINLQNSLVNRTPNIVKPSRKVIKEGVLRKVTRNGTEIKRYCVLMSDIFMYCKILKERPPNTVVEQSLECCCIFPLKKCKVYELFPGNFKLTCQGDGIIFGTSDLQLGRTWVAFIRDAIDLHIQCRKTLRKESSKRTPLRKKDVKHFDNDYVLSPKGRKSDFETIFRNKNRTTDSEDDPETDNSFGGNSCFGRKRRLAPSNTEMKEGTTNRSVTESLERSVATLSQKENLSQISFPINQSSNQKRFSKIYKFVTNDTVRSNTRSILKHNTSNDQQSSHSKGTATAYDPTYGFASRYSDTKSYFRAHNVDNTIPSAVKCKDLAQMTDTLAEGGGNLRDVLFPLRASGGSNKSSLNATSSSATNWSVPSHLKENSADVLGSIDAPPQKKRVKFDDSLDELYQRPSFGFTHDLVTNTTKTSLRDKIYDFFANLF